MADFDVDVCVTGGGPVGLSLAGWLAGQGVSVLLIEQGEALAHDLRASTFHPSTLDMLTELGVVDEMIAKGVIVPNYQIRDRRSREILADFPFELIADRTQHPYRIQFEQHKLTPLLAAYAGSLANCRILFGTKYCDHLEEDGAVRIDALCKDQQVRISARFLIGADGVGSRVRQRAGIAYDGFTYPERFYSMSTPFPFEEEIADLSFVTYMADPSEWCLMLRTPELWRLMFPVPPEEDERETLTLESTQSRLQAFYPQQIPYDIVHRTLYRVQQRVAEVYRRGRVILAGDAAHANNPLGGMGLNSGIHDAYNLKEKLLRVLSGGSTTDVLDVYSAQRRKVSIEHVNKQSADNKKRLEERDPEARAAYRDHLAEISSDPAQARAHLLRASLIDSLEEAATT